MAVSPDDLTRQPAAHGRPVLGGAYAARLALASAAPERVWALSDGEVAEAVTMLGELAASVEAQLTTVMAEAKRRSLGTGDGWGPVEWARALAPRLPLRMLLDLDAVAGAADELRPADVVDAVAVASGGGDASDALPVGKAAQIVRFHQRLRPRRPHAPRRGDGRAAVQRPGRRRARRASAGDRGAARE